MSYGVSRVFRSIKFYFFLIFIIIIYLFIYYFIYLFIFKPDGAAFYHWLSLSHCSILTISQGCGKVVDEQISLTPGIILFVGVPESLVWDYATSRAVADPPPGLTKPGFAGSGDFSCLLSMPCHPAFLILSVNASVKEHNFVLA